MPGDGSDRTLPLSDAALIDALRQEFERAAKTGAAPRIEDYLERVGEAVRPVAFRELLKAEVAWRRRGQQPVQPEDYLPRFPQFDSAIREACRDIEADRTILLVGGKAASGLHVRCPHCHNPIELVPDAKLVSIHCDSCGSTFSLTSDSDCAAGDGAGFAQVGHFKLVERLGMGAFGTVWKAQDIELDRTVAIKIPRAGQLDKQQQEFFLREARAAAQLRHPSIVPVFEVGREGDTLYIVSEFVSGVTLADRLAAGALSAQNSAKLCAKIAEALHHAHEQGVIHRDLKPANVMIDNAGEPHIMDFGLARRETREITMTVDGKILGTPAYMPPEQARGEAHIADRRSDVYSLGVILFEMLTGELPFRGNVQMLIHQVLHDEPPSPRKLNASISKDVATIAVKCLEKSASRRFATAHDLAVELQRYVAGKPIRSRPISKPVRAWRWCCRNPMYAILGLALLLITVLGFSGVSWQLAKVLRAEQEQTRIKVSSLATVASQSIADVVKSLDPSDESTAAGLRELIRSGDKRIGLRAGVALLPIDWSNVDVIYQGLLTADLAEFVAIRRVLDEMGRSGNEGLRRALATSRISHKVLDNENAPGLQRLNAAALLRKGDEFDRHADYIAHEVLRRLDDDPMSFRECIVMFNNSSPRLTDAFETVFRDVIATPRQRTNCAFLLAEMLQDEPSRLATLAVSSTPDQFKPLMNAILMHPTTLPQHHFPQTIFRELLQQNSRSHNVARRVTSDAFAEKAGSALSDVQAIQAANAAIALARLGSMQEAEECAAFQRDPAVQSHLIDRFHKLGAAPRTLIVALRRTPDASIRYSMLLALAEYPESEIRRISPQFEDECCEIYQADPDPGVHSAARLFLQKMGRAERIRLLDVSLRDQQSATRGWNVNSALQTMAEFYLPAPDAIEKQLWHSYRFAISTTEVTTQQKLEHSPRWLKLPYQPRQGDCPAISVLWSEAASYCNWLSDREGIPSEQWCYQELGADNGRPLLEAKRGALTLRGYRLPTVAEWEFACRAATETERFFGTGTDLISQYAWWGGNSTQGHVEPVATRRPNQFGMFDMYGSAIELCHDEMPGDPEHRQLRGLGAGDLEFDRTTPKLIDAVPWGNREVAGGVGFRVVRVIDQGLAPL